MAVIKSHTGNCSSQLLVSGSNFLELAGESGGLASTLAHLRRPTIICGRKAVDVIDHQ